MIIYIINDIIIYIYIYLIVEYNRQMQSSTRNIQHISRYIQHHKVLENKTTLESHRQLTQVFLVGWQHKSCNLGKWGRWTKPGLKLASAWPFLFDLFWQNNQKPRPN